MQKRLVVRLMKLRAGLTKAGWKVKWKRWSGWYQGCGRTVGGCVSLIVGDV